MKFSWKNIENWRSWKMTFFWVGHFEFFFSKKKFFFCLILIKTCQSLLVSKDGSKFWSSQMWQHFLTQTKHFDRECIQEVVYDRNLVSVSATETKIKFRYRFRGQNFFCLNLNFPSFWFKFYQKFSSVMTWKIKNSI